MKRFARKLLIIILFALNSLHISAQKSPNEFTINGGGGLSFFAYQSPMNTVFSIGYHADLGVGFTAFVSQQCGFHIGVGAGLFNVRADVGDLVNFTPNLIDVHDYSFDLYTTLHGYSETHKAKFLQLPALFLFQTKQHKKKKKKGFYAMTGAKLLLLFNRVYDSQIATFANAAYYPEFDNWTGTQLFAGLGEFAGKDADGKLNIKLLAMFTFESGIKWYLSGKCCLYTGVYFDCGLNDPDKKIRQPMSNCTSVEHLADFSLLDFYNKSYLMNIGIKLRLAFHKDNRKIQNASCPYYHERLNLKHRK